MRFPLTAILGNRSLGTVPIFAARMTLPLKIASLPRKWDCPPCAAGRGQVHVFGQPFARQMRLAAEKWTSPQPARERLPILAALTSLATLAAPAGEVLYNGIELPSPWPPQIKEVKPSDKNEPVVPPYLKNPPAVIP